MTLTRLFLCGTKGQLPSMPSPATLRKYGLTADEWQGILDRQGGVCPICGEPPKKPVVDHQHVSNWKKKKAAERKKAVRGILCSYCNFRVLPKAITLEKARNVVKYLEDYEKRKAPD